MKTCVPIIALSTVLTEKVALAPIAYWTTNPAAAAGTDRSAAINEATTMAQMANTWSQSFALAKLFCLPLLLFPDT